MKTRNSNIELMRIIAMLMVTWYHFILHANGDMILTDSGCLNKYLCLAIGSWGNVANFAFFAVTSFFSMDKHTLNIKAILQLILKVSIVGTILYFLLVMFGKIDFGIAAFIRSIGGVFTYQYWFLSAYIVFVLTLPALNLLVDNINKKYHLLLIASMFVFSSIMPNNIDLMGRISGGIITFLIVAYIRKYLKQTHKKKWFWCIIFFGLSLAVFLFEMVCSIYCNSTSIDVFQRPNSITGILGGVSLFYWFQSLQERNSKVINLLGKHAIGVYLLNFPAVVSRSIVWDTVLVGEQIYHLDFLQFTFTYIFGALLFVLIGVAMDFIYGITFEKILNKVFKRFDSRYSVLKST